jgi:cytochrome b6-f complex iron-sulfur subunit
VASTRDSAADARGERPRRAVSRRAFLRFALGAGTAGSLGAFGAASLGFMWPQLAQGFGAVLNVGPAAAIAELVRSERAPFVYPQGRLYVVTWDPTLSGAERVYGGDHPILSDGTGLMALYQKCVHLGCRVPWCQTSQYWECPCHGSQYNSWGEWVRGPAPRGLDRFPSEVDENGDLLIDTGVVLEGTARTARVLQQDPQGPHCVNV